jgi:hypothetical protein
LTLTFSGSVPVASRARASDRSSVRFGARETPTEEAIGHWTSRKGASVMSRVCHVSHLVLYTPEGVLLVCRSGNPPGFRGVISLNRRFSPPTSCLKKRSFFGGQKRGRFSRLFSLKPLQNSRFEGVLGPNRVIFWVFTFFQNLSVVEPNFWAKLGLGEKSNGVYAKLT